MADGRQSCIFTISEGVKTWGGVRVPKSWFRVDGSVSEFGVQGFWYRFAAKLKAVGQEN